MKKTMMVIALAVLLSTGTAFANHPSGLGIGLVGGWHGGWGGGGAPGGALSLKLPSLPIYWAVNLGFNSDYFSLGASGDYYFIDQKLVPEAGLNWFLGLGGWLNWYNYSAKPNGVDVTYGSVAFGARVPIGLSWQPAKFLELFLDIAPSLGIAIDSDAKYTYQGRDVVYNEGGIKFPAGGWPIELGIRIWL